MRIQRKVRINHIQYYGSPVYALQEWQREPGHTHGGWKDTSYAFTHDEAVDKLHKRLKELTTPS
jgi:hypothetical protein